MASWNQPKITNKGLELINGVLNSESITITSIKTSKRRYEVSQIPNLTNIDNIEFTVSPSSVILENGKLKISAIITNLTNDTEYRLESIGIYAKKNNVGDEILLAVLSAINSDIIPARSVSEITINFEIFLIINRDVNFSMSYNTSALLTQGDLDTTLRQHLDSKADKSTSVKSLRISNNTLYYSTHTNQEFSVTLPETTPDATDGVAGKISINSIKSLATSQALSAINTELAKYNIGAFQWKSINLNDKQTLNGIFMGNGAGGINNKYTMALNMFYSTSYGAQLLVTEETIPRLYVRYYNDGWGELQEVVYKSDVATDSNKGIISKNEIKSMFNVYKIDNFIQNFKTN